MKNLFRAISLIVFCMILTACVNKNNDNNQSDIDKQDPAPDVQIDKENDADQETNPDNNEEVKPNESESPGEVEEPEKSEVVIQNEAFQIFEPAPDEKVKNNIVVRGLARVFEGSFKYEFEDGHFIIDEGFTTASEGAPGWGEFEFTINLEHAIDGPHKIVLYEKSAKDGTIINELVIPIQVSK